MNFLKNDSISLKGLFSFFFILCFFSLQAKELLPSEGIEDNSEEMNACNSVSVNISPGTIIVNWPSSNYQGEINVVQQSNWNNIEFSCQYNCGNSPTTITIPEGGNLVVIVKLYQNYSFICQKAEYITLAASSNSNPDCDNIVATSNSNSITVDFNNPNSRKVLWLFDANWSQIGSCDPCNNSVTFPNLTPGTNYNLKTQLWTGYNYECEKTWYPISTNQARIQGNQPGNPIISLNTPKFQEGNSPLETIKLFPNPARDNITVALESPIEKQQLLQVYNMQGAVVIQKEINLNQGANRIELDIANLPSGTYTLIPVGERKIGSKTRFVKL